jgi:D-allulose-6-phosphate 3-epimerase
MFHADVMDGHFAPNIVLSSDFVNAIKPITKHPIDVHLMVTSPDDFIDTFVEAGADILSLQAETVQNHEFRTIQKIKDLGCKFGIVVCPATSLSSIEWYLDEVDILTIMTVDVGYASQKFIPQMIGKVEQAHRILKEKGYHFIIQCDGAIGRDSYKPLYEAGARAFVMGTTGLFKPGLELSEACQVMKEEFILATGITL